MTGFETGNAKKNDKLELNSQLAFPANSHTN